MAVGGLTIDGDVLEGLGVGPDINVERPLAYAGGADPVLDRAVAHLTAKAE
jgi:carboxyl-terminal processing protease